MITYQRKAGTTDVSVVIRIIDSTDGTPETGVTSGTTGLDLEYRREGAAVVDLTESDLSALTDAHSDGGMLHIGNGYYRVDLPDAACAASATGVLVQGTATGMVVIGCYIQLVAYDPFDTVRLGLTAIPNAAADAAGGLPISDAGGLDLDAILADTNELQTDDIPGTLTTILADTNELQGDWVDGGRLDLLLDAALADTNELQGDWVDGGRLDLLLDAALADTNELQTDWVDGGRLDLLLDAALADTNELQGDWVDGGRLDLLIDAILADTNELQSDDYPTTLATIVADTNELQGDWTDGGRLDLLIDAIKVITDALTSAGAAKLAASTLGIITGTVDDTAHTPTATEFEADDITEATADHFIGRIITFTSGALLGQSTDITDYALAGSNGHFTVTATTGAPGNNDTFVIT